MALLYVDGFDSYDTSALGYRWDSTTSCTIESIHPRTDGGSYLKIADSAEKLFTPSSDVLVNGFAFHISDYVANPTLFKISYFDANSSAGVEFTLNYDPGTDKFGFTCTMDGSVLFTTPNTLVSDNWYYIEIKVMIDKVNGSVLLDINNSAVGAASSVPTLTGTSTLDSYSKVVYTTGAGAYSIDDLYILDSTGTSHNNLLGNILILASHPDMPGNSSDFNSSDGNDNYSCVDEKAVDGDITFVTSDVLNAVDTYHYPNVPLTYEIKGVVTNVIARKTDAGTRSLTHVSRSSNTDYSSVDIDLTDNYKFNQQVWEKDPATSQDWTASNLNSAEFGIKISI